MSKIKTELVDEMFNRVGIDRNNFYECLRELGEDGLKTNQMKEEWSEDNPTRNYCYVVSEFLYNYITPKGTKHLSLRLEGEDYTHHYLELEDGTIIDLTAEQFDDYSIVDYSKGYSSGFIGKNVSKRTKMFAELMGYELD